MPWFFAYRAYDSPHGGPTRSDQPSVDARRRSTRWFSPTTRSRSVGPQGCGLGLPGRTDLRTATTAIGASPLERRSAQAIRVLPFGLVTSGSWSRAGNPPLVTCGADDLRNTIRIGLASEARQWGRYGELEGYKLTDEQKRQIVAFIEAADRLTPRLRRLASSLVDVP